MDWTHDTAKTYYQVSPDLPFVLSYKLHILNVRLLSSARPIILITGFRTFTILPWLRVGRSFPLGWTLSRLSVSIERSLRILLST
jgi:hypothetical protein